MRGLPTAYCSVLAAGAAVSIQAAWSITVGDSVQFATELGVPGEGIPVFEMWPECEILVLPLNPL